MKVAIVIMLLLISPMIAFAQAAPPQNFENAPIKFFCERDQPTSLQVKYFITPGQWRVIILARNGQELVLQVRSPRGAANFLKDGSGWKSIRMLSEQEQEQLNNDSRYNITDEESDFLTECKKGNR